MVPQARGSRAPAPASLTPNRTHPSHPCPHAPPLQSGLDRLHVPYSYGWSIVALTALVKLVTFPLTKTQVGGWPPPVGGWGMRGGGGGGGV